MELDLDGILRVSAIEKHSGLARHVTIEGATTAMSEAERAAARERMQEVFGNAEGEGAGNVDEAEVEETDELDDENPDGDAPDDTADLGLDVADRDDVEAGTAADTIDPTNAGGARTAAARTPAGAADAARGRGGRGDDDRREERVAASEARALLERSERLQPRMTPEDREEALALQRQIEDALKAGDWERVRAQAGELADLLFHVEER